MLEQSVQSVRELNEGPIDTFIDVPRSFIVNRLFELEVVVLDLPWVHCYVQVMHLRDEVGIGVVVRVRVHDHLSGRSDTVSVLSHHVIVVDSPLLKKLHSRQVRKLCESSETEARKALDDDRDSIFAISDLAQTTSGEGIIEHFSTIFLPNDLVLIELFDLDIQANLGVRVRRPRSILVQRLNDIDKLIKSHDIVSVVEHC